MPEFRIQSWAVFALGLSCIVVGTMEIDTGAIRRLRDGLLRSAASPEETGDGDGSQQAEATLARIEPFAETMYLVMMADGKSDPGERRAVKGALELLTDGHLPLPELEALLDRFARDASEQGAEARLMQIGAILGGDREGRETAFALAAAVALADSRVQIDENRVMAWVQEYFGISSKRSAEILAGSD